MLEEIDDDDSDEENIVERIIAALDNNQQLLESDQELNLQDLRHFMADMNYALLEIMMRIKEQKEIGKQVRDHFEQSRHSIYS